MVHDSRPRPPPSEAIRLWLLNSDRARGYRSVMFLTARRAWWVCEGRFGLCPNCPTSRGSVVCSTDMSSVERSRRSRFVTRAWFGASRARPSWMSLRADGSVSPTGAASGCWPRQTARRFCSTSG